MCCECNKPSRKESFQNIEIKRLQKACASKSKKIKKKNEKNRVLNERLSILVDIVVRQDMDITGKISVIDILSSLVKIQAEYIEEHKNGG